MKRLIFLFCIFSVPAFAESEFISQMHTLEKAGDVLGMRILIKKNYKKKLSLRDWDDVRKILKRNYSIGYDAMIAWDRQLSITATILAPERDQYQKVLEEADRMMFEKKFDLAFEKYQSVAQDTKKSSNNKIEKNNFQFYFNVLHQMGRALYGMKKFSEAAEVYTWISPSYFLIRQVMFEKMWAAFRAERYDMALGAIASQNSAYFSRYLDPESYLVKIYILKRLCRQQELKSTLKEIGRYKEELKSNKIPLKSWAKTDMFRFSIIELIDEPTKEATLALVSSEERLAEKKRIIEQMKAKYVQEKPGILSQLDKIYGYGLLAVSEGQKMLSKISELPSSKEIEKKGSEFWPADSAEEWFDEVGSHVFIGESQCIKAERK